MFFNFFELKAEKEQNIEKKQNTEQMKQEIFDQILAIVDEHGGTAKWGADLEGLLQENTSCNSTKKDFYNKNFEEAGEAQEAKKTGYRSSEKETPFGQHDLKYPFLQTVLGTLLFGIFLMLPAYTLHVFLRLISETAGRIPYLFAEFSFLYIVVKYFINLYRNKSSLCFIFPLFSFLLMVVFVYILQISDGFIIVFGGLLHLGLLLTPSEEVPFGVRICALLIVDFAIYVLSMYH